MAITQVLMVGVHTENNMADNIVPSLFGLTPETYQQQRAAQLAAEQQKLASAAAGPGTMLNPSLQPLYAQAAQRGQMMGTALGGIFGMEDPQLKMVRDVTQMRQGFDTTTPEGLQSFAQALAGKGYTDLAMQATDKANQLMKTGAEAKTAQQKYEDLNNMRDELAKLGDGASDKQILGVVKKYGSADNILKTLEMADLKRLQMNAKAQVDADKVQAAKDMGISNARNVLGVIAETKPLISSKNTGDIGGKNEIWFTGAAELQTKLDTIKANLSIDKLAQMKEASKTGASGLGSLAVKELETLQALVASLDRKQSAQSLTNSLNKIEQHYKQYIAYMSGDKTAYKQDGAGAAEAPKTITLKNGVQVTVEK